MNETTGPYFIVPSDFGVTREEYANASGRLFVEAGRPAETIIKGTVSGIPDDFGMTREEYANAFGRPFVEAGRPAGRVVTLAYPFSTPSQSG